MPSLNDVLAVILGGGRGARLYPLTQMRSKPAVPIGALRSRSARSADGFSIVGKTAPHTVFRSLPLPPAQRPVDDCELWSLQPARVEARRGPVKIPGSCSVRIAIIGSLLDLVCFIFRLVVGLDSYSKWSKNPVAGQFRKGRFDCAGYRE